VPSGATIVDASFANSIKLQDEDKSNNDNDDDYYNYDYFNAISSQTINDNEVQYFWDNLRAGTEEVSFLFTADRRGVYPTPPIIAEAMYSPEIFGRSNGTLYSIK
jgi:uncharacterized protein YfaS (alpha-2-macroglobulin family)